MKWDNSIPWERALFQLVFDFLAFMLPIIIITLGLAVLHGYFPEHISEYSVGLGAGWFGCKIYSKIMSWVGKK